VIGVQVIVGGACALADAQTPIVAIAQASAVNLVMDSSLKLQCRAGRYAASREV
jgi:hypothetical protein